MSEGLELVVLVGLQGAGKSTFCRERLGTHVLVSKDLMRSSRTRDERQRRLVDEALASGHSVVVDNTNPGIEDRRPLIDIGRARGACIVACYFDVPLAVCLARNARRVGRACVPKVGIYATYGRLRRPSFEEGFDRVLVLTPGTGLDPVDVTEVPRAPATRSPAAPPSQDDPARPPPSPRDRRREGRRGESHRARR